MSTTPPTKQTENGLDLPKHLPTVVLALVAAVPGLGAFFRDVPTRQEMQSYVRENTPYAKDKELIMQTLARFESQNEETRLYAREFNTNLIKLTAKMEVLNDSLMEFRKELKESRKP